MVIRARTFDRPATPSEIVSQTYTLVDPRLAPFNSNLPLIIINAFGHTVQKESKTPISIKFVDTAAGGRSQLSGPCEFDGRGFLNIRGNTSLRYPKRSFHLKLHGEDDQPLKVSLLGMPKESDWVLYAPYPDKTLLRDVLAYELSNQMGDYAPRIRFVEVFLSYNSKVTADDYLGVYVLEEKIKRGKERVDITKLDPDDTKEPAISGGYIFKKDHLDKMGGVPMPTEMGMPDRRGGGSMLRPGFPTGPGGFPAKPEGFLRPNGGLFDNGNPGTIEDLRVLPRSGRNIRRTFQFDGGGRLMTEENGGRNAASPPDNFSLAIPQGQFLQGFNDESISSSLGFRTLNGNLFFWVYPKPDEITKPQKSWLKRYLDRFEKALYGTDFRNPTNGYTAFIDSDSFIDHHLLVEATKNVDAFRFSTFYYKDRGEKIHMGPAWDWNLSFGNVNGKQGWLPRYWYWPQLDDQQYSWFRRLFQDPDFGQKYVDRWATLRTNVFDTHRILARIEELAAQLNEAQERNFQRWPILGRTVWPEHFVGSTYQEEIDFMKSFIETRFAWIDAQFIAAPKASLATDAVTANSELSLGAPSDKSRRIYYTLDGKDPRASGGAPSTSARVYDGPIVLKHDVKLFARAFEENLWSSPTVADFKVK